jgi:hypothetical protein
MKRISAVGRIALDSSTARGYIRVESFHSSVGITSGGSAG